MKKPTLYILNSGGQPQKQNAPTYIWWHNCWNCQDIFQALSEMSLISHLLSTILVTSLAEKKLITALFGTFAFVVSCSKLFVKQQRLISRNCIWQFFSHQIKGYFEKNNVLTKGDIITGYNSRTLTLRKSYFQSFFDRKHLDIGHPENRDYKRRWIPPGLQLPDHPVQGVPLLQDVSGARTSK